jgi:voltage-gated potassium channel
MTTQATTQPEPRRRWFHGISLNRAMHWESNLVTGLALLFLALLLMSVVANLTPEGQRRLTLAQYIIWALLAIDFFLRLATAPSKSEYLKHNWFSAIALVFPPFRILHALRAVALLSNASRDSHELKRLLHGGSAAYVLTLSGVIVIVCAAGIYSLEADAPGANITSVSDALWWASATVTTIGCEKYPVTNEGRVLAVVLMLYALAFAGYVTATLAVLLLGQNQQSSASPPSSSSMPPAGSPAPPATPDTSGLQAQLAALQGQVQALTDQLAANGRVAASADQATGATRVEST